jgi:UDP-glucose 4-epimerase
VKVLVTGGAGFVGTHVVDRLLAAGHRVSVVDDLSAGATRWLAADARLHVVDVRSDRLREIVTAERPDAVVHLAAQASVSRSVADPGHDLAVNLAGGVNVLASCEAAGVARLVYASSGGAAYSATAVLPATEDAPAEPCSPYGASKLAFELYLGVWERLYGVRSIALRLANVYGPRQNPRGEAGVVAIFCHRLLAGEPLLVNGDGLQTRDYVYVEDVAAAVCHALERPDVTGAMNIGTGVETSVNALHAALARVAGAGSAAPEHGPARPGEQRRSCLDPSRARRLLGWAPAVGLADGLARTWDFFSKEADS